MTGAKIAADAVVIRDVGPRDGLQSEAPLPVESRVALIDGLVAAGVKHVEIASFMRDDLVPAMANAEAVVAAVPARDGLTRVGLVANAKGAQRAVATGIDALSVTVSLSDAYSRKNVGRSSDDSLTALADVVAVARPDHPLLALGRPLTQEDLNEHLQLAPISRARSTYPNAIAREVWRVSDLLVRRDMMLRGIGWGTVPLHLVAEDLAAGRFSELKLASRPPELMRTDLFAIYRVDSVPGPAAQWIMEQLPRVLPQRDSQLSASTIM